MTDTTPTTVLALATDLEKRALAMRGLRKQTFTVRHDIALDEKSAATLRALADEKEAARDARADALEEAAKEVKVWLWDHVPAYAEPAAAAIRALINDTGPSIADELAQARGFIKDYQRQLSEEMVRSSVAEAKLAKVQGALDDLVIRLGDPQRRYNEIGPTWTGKSGHEYSDMSELLDFATEISEQAAAIRALIDREPEPCPDAGRYDRGECCGGECALARELRATNGELAAAAILPDGWKLVPVQATPEKEGRGGLATITERYEDDFIYLNNKLKTAARDARRAALEEAAGRCRISPQDLAEGDWGDEGAAMAEMLESRIRALIDREPTP